MFVESTENVHDRAKKLVYSAWHAFQQKVGGAFIPIYKEASMQLQYAYIYQHLIESILYRPDEAIWIELEKTITVSGKALEVDAVVSSKDQAGTKLIAIEMKCYRTKAASGKPRGAQDIFMKDVYEDINALESYMESGAVSSGIELILTDYANFISPRTKDTKNWDYDISDGATVGPKIIDTPIGGSAVHVELKRSYAFAWSHVGDFFFSAVEGTT